MAQTKKQKLDTISRIKLEKISWFTRLRFIVPLVFWLAVTLAGFPESVQNSQFLVTTGFVVLFLIYNAIIHVYSAYLIREDKLPGIKMDWFFMLQEVIDAILVLSFIYLDGGLESPVFAVFVMFILMVGLMVSYRISLLYTTICSLMYFSLLLLEYYQIIPHQYVRIQEELHLNSEFVFGDGLFIVALFYVVAYIIHFLTKESEKVEEDLSINLLEKNKLEKDYRDLSENAFDPIQRVSPDGGLVYVNKKWKEILGYSSDEVAEMKVFDIIKKSDVTAYKKALSDANMKNKNEKIKVSYRTKRGKDILFEVSISGRFDKSGEFVSTREILRDVTVSERLNKELKKKARDLEVMNESLIGRELKMVQMQKEISELKNQLLERGDGEK